MFTPLPGLITRKEEIALPNFQITATLIDMVVTEIRKRNMLPCPLKPTIQRH